MAHEAAHLVQQRGGAHLEAKEDGAPTKDDRNASASGQKGAESAPAKGAVDAGASAGEQAEPAKPGEAASSKVGAQGTPPKATDFEAEADAAAQVFMGYPVPAEGLVLSAAAQGVMYQEGTEDEADAKAVARSSSCEDRIVEDVGGITVVLDPQLDAVAESAVGVIEEMNRLIPEGYQVEGLIMGQGHSTGFRVVDSKPTVVVGQAEHLNDEKVMSESVRHEMVWAYREYASKQETELEERAKLVESRFQQAGVELYRAFRDFDYGAGCTRRDHAPDGREADYSVLERKYQFGTAVEANAGNEAVSAVEEEPSDELVDSAVAWDPDGTLTQGGLDTDAKMKPGLVMVDPANWGEEREHPEDRAEEFLATAVSAVLGNDKALDASIDFTLKAVWQQVDHKLRGGKVRLLFVADQLPSELRRVIEFLNEKMEDVEVLGIELRQYATSGFRALVPRIVGQTESTRTAKRTASPQGPKTTSAALLERCEEPAREFFAQMLLRAEAEKLVIYWGSKGFSVRVPTTSGLVTILYGFPPGTRRRTVGYLWSVVSYLSQDDGSDTVLTQLLAFPGARPSGASGAEIQLATEEEVASAEASVRLMFDVARSLKNEAMK